MTAVAVLERPYTGLPSMSVAWMISVYWGTFWRGGEEEATAGLKTQFFEQYKKLESHILEHVDVLIIQVI